ncbi:MAG: PIG-L family deacetylase [Bryobacteraceae bacterium]|nr:PIG-L family deacetylase [Bryobacteraceae bacterium]
MDISRRGLLGLPLAAQAQTARRPLTVVVAGGHPDDPETGAGGTMARYAKSGHKVVALYLTRGEAGIRGASHAEAAKTRTAEAEAACRILGATPVFAGQVDGDTEVNRARHDAFRKLLEDFAPDVVFTHYPIDTHRDHRAVSDLVYDAFLRTKRKFSLYYFEVLTGEQTQTFHPSDYVDITAAEPLKRKACFAHQSQNPEGFYPYHETMSRFRGMECGTKHAEAFLAHAANARAAETLRGL